MTWRVPIELCTPILERWQMRQRYKGYRRMHLKLPGDSSNIHTINPKECTVCTTYIRLDLRIFFVSHSPKTSRYKD